MGMTSLPATPVRFNDQVLFLDVRFAMTTPGVRWAFRRERSAPALQLVHVRTVVGDVFSSTDSLYNRTVFLRARPVVSSVLVLFLASLHGC